MFLTHQAGKELKRVYIFNGRKMLNAGTKFMSKALKNEYMGKYWIHITAVVIK